MEVVSVKIDKSLDESLIGKRVPGDFKVSRIVKPNTIIKDEDTGEILIVFGKLDGDWSGIKKFLPGLPFTANDRLTRRKNDFDNLKASDLQFGFKPKRPVFNLAASACNFNSHRPNEYKSLTELGLLLQGLYQKHSQKKYDRQVNIMSAIQEHWKIPGTFFTQGIVNDTVNLDFHYDRGNITGCWSCMAVFMRDVHGGSLIVPPIDSKLEISDETFVLFDGQSLLHGVSPITKTSRHGRRFSIVYYAIEAMKNCGTYAQELQKMRDIDMRKHKKATK